MRKLWYDLVVTLEEFWCLVAGHRIEVLYDGSHRSIGSVCLRCAHYRGAPE